MTSVFYAQGPYGSNVGLVVGLIWRTVAMGDPLQVSRSTAKKNKASHLTQATERGAYAAPKLKVPMGKDSPALYSAGRVMGQVYGTAFFALELPDQALWTCWVKDGTPVLDEVITMNASDVVLAYQSYSQMDGFGDAHICISHASMLDGVSHQTMQFSDVYSYITDDKTAQLSPLSVQALSPKTLTLLLGTLLLIAAYYAYQHYDKRQKRAQLKLLQEQSQSQAQSQLQTQILAIQTQWYASKRGVNREALKQLRQTLGAMSYRPGGWHISSISCDLQKTGWSCVADYKRKNSAANNQSLAQALPSQYAIAYKNLTEASAAFAIESAVPNLDKIHVLSVNAHEIGTINTLQSMDAAFVTVSLKPYQKEGTTAVNPSGKPDADNALVAAAKQLPMSRELMMAGPLRNVDVILNHDLPIVWNKLVVTMTDNASPSLKSSYAMVQLNGVFYAFENNIQTNAAMSAPAALPITNLATANAHGQ